MVPRRLHSNLSQRLAINPAEYLVANLELLMGLIRQLEGLMLRNTRLKVKVTTKAIVYTNNPVSVCQKANVHEIDWHSTGRIDQVTRNTLIIN